MSRYNQNGYNNQNGLHYNPPPPGPDPWALGPFEPCDVCAEEMLNNPMRNTGTLKNFYCAHQMFF